MNRTQAADACHVRAGEGESAHERCTQGRHQPMDPAVNPLVLLAAWSVLSVPASLAVGAVLSAAGRRNAEPVLATVPARARRTA